MPAIDYRRARAELRLADMLALIGYEPRSRQGQQWRGPCPLHGSRSAALTLFSCLVQPRGCNPAMKKAAQSQRHRSTGSDGNDEKEEKIFYGDGPSIDFRGHLAVRRPQAPIPYHRPCG